jgi:hypothetical protein
LARWQRAGQVWTIEQQANQSVDDYVASIVNAANNSGLTDEQVNQAIIKGLRPSIRQYVLRQQPADLDELRSAAKLAEQTEIPATSGSDAITSSIARLEEQMKLLTVAAFAGRQQSPADDNRQQWPERFQQRVSSPNRARRQVDADRYYRRRDVTFADDVPVRGHEEPSSFSACDSCGRTDHPRRSCRYRFATCSSCGKTGHLSSVCRSARRQ